MPIPLSCQYHYHANTIIMPNPLSYQYHYHTNTIIIPMPLSYQYHCHTNTIIVPIPLFLPVTLPLLLSILASKKTVCSEGPSFKSNYSESFFCPIHLMKMLKHFALPTFRSHLIFNDDTFLMKPNHKQSAKNVGHSGSF